VQLHVGLHIAFGILRLGAGGGVCQRRLQPLAQLRMDARGSQPGQHAFQLGQAFHHGHQLARIQPPHIDARARNDLHQPLGHQQQQRLAHGGARGAEAFAQSRLVDGVAGPHGARAQLVFQRLPYTLLQAGRGRGFLQWLLGWKHFLIQIYLID